MAKEKHPDFISQLVELDKSVSRSLSLSASKSSPLGHLRSHMKALEYSCHGIFWIAGSIIGLWFSTPERAAFFFNLLLALILDIIFVAILKAAIHRKRPSYNKSDDMFLTISIDKMSCPSGHTSRAVLLTFLFVSLTPEWNLFHLVLTLWCFSTAVSRVLLGRHHVGDVVVGLLLGYFEYIIMEFLWAGSETAEWYLSIFRDSNSILDEF